MAEAESRQRAYLLLDSERLRRDFTAGVAELRANQPHLMGSLADSGISESEAERFLTAANQRIATLEEVVRLKGGGAREAEIGAILSRGLAEMAAVKQLGVEMREGLARRLRSERLANHRTIRNAFQVSLLLNVIVLALTLISLFRLNRSLTENRKAIRSIADEKERFRHLAGKLDSAREEERAEVARNIHDDLGQRLTAIKMDLAMALRKLNPEDSAVKKQIDSAMEMADEAILTVRGLAMELRPALLDQLGLAAALKWLLEEFSRRTNISTALEAPPEFPQVDRGVSTAVYRIIQEALTNAARHSGASRVLVTLAKDGEELHAVVEDNGRGFDPGEVRGLSVGLLAMEERARLMRGTVQFLSRPGAGTKVVIRAPLPEKEAQEKKS